MRIQEQRRLLLDLGLWLLVGIKFLPLKIDAWEKEDAKKIQKDNRHIITEAELIEHNNITDDSIDKNDILEIVLYRKANEKPLSLENMIIKKLENENLQKVIDTLPEKQRRRLLLYYKYELTLEKIAEIEQCSFGAIKVSIHKALRNLKNELLKEN